MKQNNTISVVMPVYNEAGCIERTLRHVIDFCSLYSNYEFIFINDGSTDKTQEILTKTLGNSCQYNISCISYSPNKGKGYAVKIGVDFANGDYICYLDSDLAYSLDNLIILADKLEGMDIVIGSRSQDKNNQKVSLIRKIAGQIFNYLSRTILNLPFTDMQAGIKGFKKDVAKNLFKRQFTSGFSFDVELIYLAWKWGYSIGEIPVVVLDTHLCKKSKVNLFKDSLKMLVNLFQIQHNYSIGKYE